MSKLNENIVEGYEQGTWKIAIKDTEKQACILGASQHQKISLQGAPAPPRHMPQTEQSNRGLYRQHSKSPRLSALHVWRRRACAQLSSA